MALIKCPECGKEISDKAISCPGCGAPMGQQMTSAYQMLIPQEKYKSSMGSLLRLSVFLTWILGISATVVCCFEFQQVWVLVLIIGIVACLLLSVIPLSLAEFYDDVHAIRCTLQNTKLVRKNTMQGKVSA